MKNNKLRGKETDRRQSEQYKLYLDYYELFERSEPVIMSCVAVKPPSGGRWKVDVIRQLKRRDQRQHEAFSDLIRHCKYRCYDICKSTLTGCSDMNAHNK